MRFFDIDSQCIVLFPEDLDREDIDWFWDKGVDMDDWDRMVIAEVGTLAEVEEASIIRDHDEEKLPVYEQTVPELYKIAEGCFCSTWHIIEFDDGEEKAVGVAYHA